MVSPSWTSVVCPIAEKLDFSYRAQAPELPPGPARVSVCFRGSITEQSHMPSKTLRKGGKGVGHRPRGRARGPGGRFWNLAFGDVRDQNVSPRVIRMPPKIAVNRVKTTEIIKLLM